MSICLLLSPESEETYISLVVETHKNVQSLDIVLTEVPSSLNDVEYLLRKLYGQCLVTDPALQATIFPYFQKQDWDAVYAPKNLDYSKFDLEVTALDTPKGLKEAPRPDVQPNREYKLHQEPMVAVGGTFDHFHIGHKLLLTVTALFAQSSVIVGLTGDKLLENKQFVEVMDNYSDRMASVLTFLGDLFPDLEVHIEEIDDVYGPTARMPEITGLVTSKETQSGGKEIQQMRSDKNWKELSIFVVGLIPSTDGSVKLSSTYFRALEVEKEKL